MQDDYPFEPEPRRGLSLPILLFWTLALFGPAAYFGYQGDYFVAAVLAFAGIGAFSGYRMGALSIVMCLGSFAAVIMYAPSLGIQFEQKFQDTLGTTGLVNRGISVVTVALAIAFAVWLLNHFVLGRLVRRQPQLDQFNRRTGFAVGMLQGAFAIVLFVGGIVVMAPIQKQRLANHGISEDEGSLAHTLVFWTDAQVDKSSVSSLLREYNPIERIPQLNQVQKVQQTAAVLSDPAKIDDLMHHPSIEQLRSSPEVRQVVDSLRQDESIQKILNSGQPMSKSAAMTLLSHPAVLELVDQPGFLEQASKAIEDVGL